MDAVHFIFFSFHDEKMGIRCFNQFNEEVSPYDVCPECDDVYKDCPHMKTDGILLLLRSGCNVDCDAESIKWLEWLLEEEQDEQQRKKVLE